MDAKKVYESPEAEVICFGADDIVRTSGETTLPPVSGSSDTTNLY